METLMVNATNSQLKTVLQKYQLSATKSLQGPSSALLAMECKGLLQKSANICYSPTNCETVDVSDFKEHNNEPHCNNKKEEFSPPLPRRSSSANSKELRIEKVQEDSDDELPPKASFDKRDLEFHIPILTAPDQSSKSCETLLEGEKIACFIVGGERRLCLPQILNTVLIGFSLSQINQVCDELQIYCSRCNREQLEELKVSGILPKNAPSCGLITQTDAERLVSALLSRTESYVATINRSAVVNSGEVDCKKEIINKECLSSNKFKVYHECFGKCKGIFDTELFTSEDSLCIECLECGCLLSPQRFVRHTHGSSENRTCHWGFDSTNWRNYLLLSRDQHNYSKISDMFQDIKDKNLVPECKRKLEVPHEEKSAKRIKKDKDKDDFPNCFYNSNGLGIYAGPPGINDPYLQLAMFDLAARGGSAFRPWNPACKFRESSPLVPPFLSHGPPVLQHPERVVPLSECERFEPHFQPNVALAPVVVTHLPALIPPTPTLPPSLPTPSSHNRHHNHIEIKPIDPFIDNVKIEKPSSPSPDVPNYTIESPSLDKGKEEEEHITTVIHKDELQIPKQEPKDDEEEDDCNAAVTSSTASFNFKATQPNVNSSTESEIDIKVDCSLAVELEERLIALNVPQDTLNLARLVVKNFTSEIRNLHQENLKLQNQLWTHQSESSVIVDNDNKKKSEIFNKKSEAVKTITLNTNILESSEKRNIKAIELSSIQSSLKILTDSKS